jgi:outer membrane lipoprotein-sorting protein
MRLAKFAGFALAAALIAMPAWAQSGSQSSQSQSQQSQAAAQSVTGTVVSVTDTALTLNTATSGSESSQEQSSAASQMRFVIDSNTKIDGTPTAGARATVEYTTDSNGRKVATHVTIQS